MVLALQSEVIDSVYIVDRPIHHQLIFNAYQKSFLKRQLTVKYQNQQIKLLETVFKMLDVADEKIPQIKRAIDTFDLFDPILAQKIVNTCYETFGPKKSPHCLKAIHRYHQFYLVTPMHHQPGHHTLNMHQIYGLPYSPVSKYSIPKTRSERNVENYLTKSEYKDFIGYAWSRIAINGAPDYQQKAQQLYLMCVFAGEMGLRLNELLNLKLKQVNVSDSTCIVTHGKGSSGKGHKKRQVLMTQLAKTAFTEFLNLNPRQFNDYLFQNADTSQVTLHQAGHWFRKLINEIKQTNLKIHMPKGFGWHALRRTFATNFLDETGDLKSLQYLMGWSYASTAAFYIGYCKQPIRTGRIPLIPFSEG